jgi:ubiquinone/menaquinone biosynthesis C-methylase UbiE
MGFHTFDADRAANLEDASRYRHCSREELLSLLGVGAGSRVLDVGSGTGFYTRDVAAAAEAVYALDVQDAMHGAFAEYGVPPNVRRLTAVADAVPLRDDAVDAAFSTMTYHEFAGPDALAELARVVRPGGRVVTVDWSARGAGESGPPVDERYALEDVVESFADAGFGVTHAASRLETFVCVAAV